MRPCACRRCRILRRVVLSVPLLLLSSVEAWIGSRWASVALFAAAAVCLWEPVAMFATFLAHGAFLRRGMCPSSPATGARGGARHRPPPQTSAPPMLLNRNPETRAGESEDGEDREPRAERVDRGVQDLLPYRARSHGRNLRRPRRPSVRSRTFPARRSRSLSAAPRARAREARLRAFASRRASRRLR